jgi:isocitrate dehydrogenase (NAD+)
MIIDNCCMQLILRPQQFDVMVMPNLYGAIVSNIALGITGGPGLTPGAMIGEKYSIFETGGRHAGKDIAGKNIANPSAFLLSYCMMLKHLGLPFFAQKLETGIYKTLGEGKAKTFDIGGNNTTDEFTDEIIKNINGS